MEEELYLDLKKGKPQAVEKLMKEHLARSWFLAQEITLDDLLEGDMVAVVTGEDGSQTVTVLDYTGDSGMDASETRSDSSSSEESGE